MFGDMWREEAGVKAGWKTRETPLAALAVLDFIERFQEVRGYPPTLSEIARGTGRTSTGALSRLLKALQREGLLGTRRCRRDRWPIHRARMDGMAATPEQ
jgi:SOS-response transcriptional repressor LexA